jgi:HD superfamily phosphodiesterase
VTELVKDTESPLLFHHSSRVYYWGALTGKRRGLRFDPELLYAGAMFHDMGLTPQHASADVKADVLADKDPSFRPINFCRVIRASLWSG